MRNSVKNESLNNYSNDSSSNKVADQKKSNINQEVKVYTDFFLKLSKFISKNIIKSNYSSYIKSENVYVSSSGTYPFFIGLSCSGENFYQITEGIVRRADFMIVSQDGLGIAEVKEIFCDVVAKLLNDKDLNLLFRLSRSSNEFEDGDYKIIDKILEDRILNEKRLKNFFFCAIKNDNLILTEKLLDCGVDVDCLSGAGKNPLFLAMENRCFDIARLLLESGGDIGPSLFYSIGNNKEIFDNIMNFITKENIGFENKDAIFFNKALQCNNAYFFEELICNGANIYLESSKGVSLKDIVADKNDKYFIELLRDVEKAHLLAVNFMSEDRLDKLRALLDKNPFLKKSPVNREGENLLDVAIKKSSKRFAKYLKKIGIQPKKYSMSDLLNNEQKCCKTPFNSLLASKPVSCINVFEGLDFDMEDSVESDLQVFTEIGKFKVIGVHATPANEMLASAPSKKDGNIFMKLIDSRRSKFNYSEKLLD